MVFLQFPTYSRTMESIYSEVPVTSNLNSRILPKF